MKPELFVGVRHGDAEHNYVRRLSKRGDHSHYEGAFGKRSNFRCRLTTLGREQLAITGLWIQENLPPAYFDRYYCSEATRAMESALCMNLPGAEWSPEHILREQDSGIYCTISEERRRALRDAEAPHLLDSRFLYRPLGAESMADMVENRIERFSDRLKANDYPRVICVNHGRLMDGFRFRWCHWTIEEWEEKENEHDERFDIGNGQVHLYSRRHPSNGQLASYFSWFKAVRPTDLKHPSNTELWDDPAMVNGWVPISLRRFTNDDLRAIVNRVPQLVDTAV